jgi:hypothetical protein
MGDSMSESEESASNSPIHDRVSGESSNEGHAYPDVADLNEDKDDDNESTFSCLSDPDTDELLSICATGEGNSDDKTRLLGLSRPWRFSDYDDYEWVAHHCLFLTPN